MFLGSVAKLPQCPLISGGLDRLAGLTQFFYQLSHRQSLALNLRGFKSGGRVGVEWGGIFFNRWGGSDAVQSRSTALSDRVRRYHPIAQGFFNSATSASIGSKATSIDSLTIF